MNLRPLPGAGASEVRRTITGLLLSLRDNWSLGLFALVLASVLWVIITNEQNPPQTGAYSNLIRIEPVNVPPELDVLKSIEPVVVRITAPLDQWQRLTPDSFRATVDLSGLDAGEHEVNVQVEASDSRIRINEVQPARVKIELDRLQRQTVAIHVNVQQPPPFGYAAGEPKLSVDRAVVAGPAQLVASIDSVVADVNLSASRTELRQSYRLSARTARGYNVDGVTVEPQTVLVEVPIRQEVNFQSFSVVPEVRGNPAPGYWLARATVRPTTVTVVGPREVLQTMATLRTQPIDLTTLTATATRNISLDLPAGVTPLVSSTVEVELQLLPVKGTIPLRLTARVEGLPAGRQVANPEALAVSVVIAGEGPGLLELGPDKVTATVDLRGLGTGTFNVEPRVQVPAPFTVESVTPRSMTLTVR